MRIVQSIAEYAAFHLCVKQRVLVECRCCYDRSPFRARAVLKSCVCLLVAYV